MCKSEILGMIVETMMLCIDLGSWLCAFDATFFLVGDHVPCIILVLISNVKW